MGLIKAAEKFDDRKNVRFSTYASWWIKQAITRSLVNSRRAIRLPHRKEELLKRIQRTYNSAHPDPAVRAYPRGNRPRICTSPRSP